VPNDPQTTLDATDRAILEAVSQDARITNQRLAERVGVAPSTALARLRALRERGVVRGFHAEVDLGVKALQDAVAAQRADALEASRRGDPGALRKPVVRHPRVLAERFEDRDVHGVQRPLSIVRHEP